MACIWLRRTYAHVSVLDDLHWRSEWLAFGKWKRMLTWARSMPCMWALNVLQLTYACTCSRKTYPQHQPAIQLELISNHISWIHRLCEKPCFFTASVQSHAQATNQLMDRHGTSYMRQCVAHRTAKQKNKPEHCQINTITTHQRKTARWRTARSAFR